MTVPLEALTRSAKPVIKAWFSAPIVARNELLESAFAEITSAFNLASDMLRCPATMRLRKRSTNNGPGWPDLPCPVLLTAEAQVVRSSGNALHYVRKRRYTNILF